MCGSVPGPISMMRNVAPFGHGSGGITWSSASRPFTVGGEPSVIQRLVTCTSPLRPGWDSTMESAVTTALPFMSLPVTTLLTFVATLTSPHVLRVGAGVRRQQAGAAAGVDEHL